MSPIISATSSVIILHFGLLYLDVAAGHDIGWHDALAVVDDLGGAQLVGGSRGNGVSAALLLADGVEVLLGNVAHEHHDLHMGKQRELRFQDGNAPLDELLGNGGLLLRPLDCVGEVDARGECIMRGGEGRACALEEGGRRLCVLRSRP